MNQQSNLRTVSHWELVELAERLMSEASDTERFLPAYDEALAADNDVPLINFCARLLIVALRRARATADKGCARSAAFAAMADSSRAA
jgi:hypothetical protein